MCSSISSCVNKWSVKKVNSAVVRGSRIELVNRWNGCELSNAGFFTSKPVAILYCKIAQKTSLRWWISTQTIHAHCSLDCGVERHVNLGWATPETRQIKVKAKECYKYIRWLKKEKKKHCWYCLNRMCCRIRHCIILLSQRFIDWNIATCLFLAQPQEDKCLALNLPRPVYVNRFVALPL